MTCDPDPGATVPVTKPAALWCPAWPRKIPPAPAPSGDAHGNPGSYRLCRTPPFNTTGARQDHVRPQSQNQRCRNVPTPAPGPPADYRDRDAAHTIERPKVRPAARGTQPVTRRWGLRRWTGVLFGVAALAACAIACAAYLYVHYFDVVRYSAEQGRVTVERAELGRLGTVLVTNKGFALYIFLPDAAHHVTCTGDCATAWPPLTVHAGETFAASAGVRADLLGTAPDPGGARVVTYHGWPLYTYLGDASPGHAAGQGKDDDGGYWYVMRPSGQIVSP